MLVVPPDPSMQTHSSTRNPSLLLPFPLSTFSTRSATPLNKPQQKQSNCHHQEFNLQNMSATNDQNSVPPYPTRPAPQPPTQKDERSPPIPPKITLLKAGEYMEMGYPVPGGVKMSERKEEKFVEVKRTRVLWPGEKRTLKNF